MKKFVCDICGKEVGEYELRELNKQYRSDGMGHICDDCDNELTKAKRAMDNAVEALKDNWIHKIIKKMISRKER